MEGIRVILIFPLGPVSRSPKVEEFGSREFGSTGSGTCGLAGNDHSKSG